MGARSSLRFDPVTCVVTLVLGESDELRVFGVRPGSGVVQAQDGQAQQYSVVHGSIVCVGHLKRTYQDAEAAIVFDMPDGWRRATGTARVRTTKDGMLQARIQTETSVGEQLVMNVQCRCIDQQSVVQTLSATS